MQIFTPIYTLKVGDKVGDIVGDIRNKVCPTPLHLPAPKDRNADTEEPLRVGVGGEGVACLA